MTNLDQVAKDYGLSPKEREVAQCLVDVGSHPGKVSDLVPRFEMGAHPLAALMGIHATYPAAKKYSQEKGQSRTKKLANHHRATETFKDLLEVVNRKLYQFKSELIQPTICDLQ
jgi:hypothetical protein